MIDLSLSKFRTRSEIELLKIFVAISIGLHLFFMLGGLNFFGYEKKNAFESEWEIEADLAVGIKGEQQEDSIDNSVKGDEIKVNKQILPQLTKTFEVEKDQPKKAADIGEVFDEKKDVAEERKREAAVKLKKEEALRRLLKERARNEQKFADNTTSPLANKLQARKRELEGNDFSLGSEKKVLKFVKQVQIAVKRNYLIPEIYRNSTKEMKVGVGVVLDKLGQIEKIGIATPSGNEGFDQLGIETIKKAAPLPVPPKELIGKEFVLNFTT